MASSSSSSPELSGALAASSSQEYASVQYSDLSREEVLEDLSSRFILNLPEEELASVERVCFQVEQAHWYYEDFVREQNPSKFPSHSLKTFSEALFRTCPLLAHWAQDHDKTFASFMQYKTRVPVCGAIMLNDTWDKCVLVKGWKSSAGWGFPKGKINEQEPKHRCAIREVLEETGYNLENQLDPENVIQLSIKEQSISLYIVPGVPEDFPFATRTRKEISKIAWFRLSDLPTWKRNKPVPGKFYLISPFIGPLKAFIHDRKPRNTRRKAPRAQNVQVSGEHASSEEDGAGSVQGSPSSLVDSNAQELSSQSSSADHGEPHTPSPQYSAARVHQTTFDTGDNASVENPIANASNTDHQHLTKLISGLVRSAASLSVEEPAKAGLATAGTMPALTSVPLSSQQSFNDPTVSPDWSAHVPPQRSSNFSHELISQARSSPAIAARSPEHTPMQAGVSEFPSASATPAMKEPGHGRRSSKSQADLSPYLSRPKAISKEMKYISMLESVAQESDRVASRIGHRPPIPVPQGLSSYPPPPPPSVPPEMIYSSGGPPRPAQQMPYPPPPLNGASIRPSTSLALHHPPSHPAMVPRQSMNEAQLRSMLPLNGPWPHAPAPNALPGAPFPPHVPGPMNAHRTVPPPRSLYTPSIGQSDCAEPRGEFADAAL
ncbi:DCP2-domain-containing protein [Trametes coccinea BRFM310]|uniref:DCP2-domain-containing protein n=1 Tax=Trametes coccinea (strain BRFM310) TaxID=1353009 RepID=A0A1Y2ITY9_TRAC3|nr:DCP2-domain-containing protein [Trametes coccinea BRFM310]